MFLKNLHDGAWLLSVCVEFQLRWFSSKVFSILYQLLDRSYKSIKHSFLLVVGKVWKRTVIKKSIIHRLIIGDHGKVITTDLDRRLSRSDSRHDAIWSNRKAVHRTNSWSLEPSLKARLVEHVLASLQDHNFVGFAVLTQANRACHIKCNYHWLTNVLKG